MAERPYLPLIEWGADLRRAAARKRRLRRGGLAVGALIALVGSTIAVDPAPRLVWNASASAPVGLYWVIPGAPLAAGDMVIAWTPEPFRQLAAERHYLPRNVPLVKAIGAGPGDTICGVGESIYINGRSSAVRRMIDGAGRPMPTWTGCETLRSDHYLLLMAGASDSFDGRYFGAVDAAQIVGKAVPLWVR